MRIAIAAAAALLAGAALMGSCRKENGIDNETVIRKPYGLYASNAEGALLNTNTGDDYKLIFPPDGYPSRALLTYGKNIVWIKANLFYSDDNGKNFNSLWPGGVSAAGFNQSMILAVPSHDRIYVASTLGKGIAYSADSGRSWTPDGAFDTLLTPNPLFSSFAQLSNGVLFAFDGGLSSKIYRRDNKDDRWSEFDVVGLPPSELFYLGAFNNRLVAASYGGPSGVYFSNDSGRNWAPYSGISNVPVLCMATPFSSALLVGTDSNGVYRLAADGTNFVRSSAGLDGATSVYGIVGKDNLFKNGAVRQYVFATTSTGIYRSEDGGQNWVKVLPGDFRSIY